MLVCLDEWRFEMHGGTLRTHSSSTKKSESLHVGNVHTTKFLNFCEVFRELLQVA
jgi:hypothetical protein